MKKFKYSIKNVRGIVGGLRFHDETAICDKNGFILFVAMFATDGEVPIVGGYRYRDGRMVRHVFIENEDNDELQRFAFVKRENIPHDFMEL